MTMRISKRQYVSGTQCDKRLWLETHEPEKATAPGPDAKARLEQGIEVGRLAKNLYPDGRAVDGEALVEQHLARSRKALAQRRPLFESAFATDSAYARADILVPSGDAAWDLIEVKSVSNPFSDKAGKKMKPELVTDLAFQLFVAEQAGLQVASVSLLHIDSSYRRAGEVKPARLFKRLKATAKARAEQDRISKDIIRMQGVVTSEVVPDVKIGRQCDHPYACPFTEHCWAAVPDDSVHTLYLGGKRARQLWEDGHRTLLDIPDEFRLTARQRIQVKAAKSGEAVVNRAAIKRFLKRLKFPLYFLDFETFSSAVPPFNGTGPYNQIPFQFSLHVLTAPDTEPTHHEFLAADGSDPRPALLDSLKKLLGNRGSIVTYNAPFERSRFKEMAREFGTHTSWLRKSIPRFTDADLMEPFEAFHYYHPKQHGRTSIKYVLPVLTPITYAGMPIANGAVAASEFRRITQNPPPDDAHEVRQHLLKYCSQDTFAMVEIYRRLRALVAK